MNVQIVEIGGKQAAVLPVDEYRCLLEKAEQLEDISAYDKAKAALMSAEDERIPAELVKSLLDGENAIKVWRRHRGLSQRQLADTVGISQAYLAQIETGKREGGIAVYRAMAEALAIGLDDLLADGQ